MKRAEINIFGFVWDELNEAKLAAHGVTPEDIEGVLANQPRFFTNLPHRFADFVMLGPDMEDRFFFAPIVPTQTDGIWYPVTAYRLERRRALLLYEGG